MNRHYNKFHIGIFLISVLIMLQAVFCLYIDAQEMELAARIAGISGNEGSPEKQVMALTRWVHDNVRMIEKDPSKFRPVFRDSFVQILEKGGLCGERARVLILLCSALNIPASRLYLSDSGDFSDVSNKSRHVLVKTPYGIFDAQYLYFTKKFPCSFSELTFFQASDTEKETARQFIGYSSAGFNYTGTFGRMAYRFFSCFADPGNVDIPVFMERPWLLYGILLILLAVFICGIPVFLSWMERRKNES